MHPDIRIEDLNLSQILQLSLETGNLNYYALALAKSRHAAPDQLSVSLTLQLLEINGQKWAEVLERQAINNYSLVYSVACQNRLALDVLVGLASEQRHIGELKNLCLRILQQFEEGGALWSAFYVLLKISLEMTDQKYKFQLLLNINRLVEIKKLPILLQNLAASQLNAQNQVLRDNSSVTFFHIYRAIVRLYSNCAKRAVKKGQLTALKNVNHSLINYFYEIFNNTLAYINHYSQNQERNPHQFKETLISYGLLCLQQLAQLPQLQLNFLDNQQNLVKGLMALPLLRQASSVQDRLNFQYGLSCGQYGQDLQSVLAQTIVILSSHVPGILKSVLISIRDYIINQEDRRLVTFGLVLLSVIGKLVVVRDDLVAQTVTPLLEYLINNSTQQTPLELKCRILRVLVFYGQIISQQQYHFLLTSTLNLLCYQPCNSFAYHEADNIFEVFVQRSSTASTLGRLSTFIKQSLNHTINILLDVITKIRQVTSSLNDQKSMRLVRLLSMLMSNNQRQVTEISAKVIHHSINWLLDEISSAWSQRMKHNALIHQLVMLLKLAVSLIDMEQNYVNNASDQLYKVFQLLLHPERLEIIDQIIEILSLKIQKQAMMDGKLCQALVTSLQCVVSYQKGNLGIVSNVLKALNNPTLARQIIFQWGDLITYLASLYLNYFSNFLQETYVNLYEQQFNQIGSFFEKYLQVYEAYFESNPQFRMNLLQNIRAMPSCEWRYRFFLILHHQDSVSGYDFFMLDQVSNCSKRGTMKLIFFYYIDKLLRNYQQNTLNQLLQFNRIFEQKKVRRQFKDQPIEGIPFPQIILKTYLYEGFRELKKKNCIDLVQYTTIIKDFKLE